jgi:hypothetical protein
MEQVTMEFGSVIENQSPEKFKPKFLHELVDYVYSDLSDEIRQHELKQILNDSHGKGHFWEQVLKKAMPHTTILERNAPKRDYEDNSDAKFALLGNYNFSTQRQATISGVENKIGPLRVCLCVRGQHIHKVYFMFIPYEAHSKIKGENIKVTFKNFMPSGAWWDKYQCTWEEVIQPV